MAELVVYAVLANDQVPVIKFGRTKRLARRLTELSREYPNELKLLGSVSGGNALEQMIHGSLDKHRLFGEWYRYEGWAKTVARLICMDRLDLLYKYLDKISALR